MQRPLAKDGFLNVHKPAGVSSHKCVMVVRKLFQTRQVGHGGTLDPMATGVLTMALGKATKFLQYLTSDKEYSGVIRFGVTTSSDDTTGDVLSEQAAPWLSEHQVQTVLQRYVGTIDQIPPRVSAIKKDGVRLYELARMNQASGRQCCVMRECITSGATYHGGLTNKSSSHMCYQPIRQQVDLQPRRVHIRQIDLHAFRTGAFPEADIRVVCGAGTYIRSIARECGEALTVPPEWIAAAMNAPRNAAGELYVGGALSALERSRSGIFGLDTSLSFDEIRARLEAGENPLQSIESALEHLASVKLSGSAAHRWQIGGITWIRSADVVPGGVSIERPKGQYALTHGETIRVYSCESPPAFLGVSQVERQTQSDGFVLRSRSFAPPCM